MKTFALALVALSFLLGRPATGEEAQTGSDTKPPQANAVQGNPVQGNSAQGNAAQSNAVQATAPPAASALVKSAAVVQDCVGDNRFIYHAGTPILRTTTFLPAGNSADFIVQAEFKPQATYYVKFEVPYLKQTSGGKNAISVAPIAETSPYVKNGLANKGDLLATVNVPPEIGSYWRAVLLHIYACEDSKSPSTNGVVRIRASSSRWCTPVVLATVLLLYLAAAFAFRRILPEGDRRTVADEAARKRFLDPVVLTAGVDGKGSLAKLQILFFSVIVFALLLFILLRTGELSALSETVLYLLGIAAVGSTAAKGADQQQNRLDFDNWSWLVQKGWIGVRGLARSNEARWSDIFTSDGEFDVYRYQSCIFSLIVGGALLVVGVSQLASFEIPTSLLGVLGLSQVVYVAGKLVSPPAMADLNKAIKALRDLERAVQDAAAKAVPPADDVDDARIATEVQRYRSAASTAADLLHVVTNLARPTNFEPSLR
jgi:hypothetical protein